MFSKFEIEAVNRGYTISEDGIVFNKNGKQIGTSGKDKYKYFSFRIDGKIIKVYFHRFQAYLKFGDKIYKDDMVIRHLNGDLLDNSWVNIEIGTQSDNMMDVTESIRVKRSSNANKKYPDKLVNKIKQYYRSGHTYKETMKKFNISSKGTLSYIINNR